MNKDTGLVYTLKTTVANVHDVTRMPQLLSGEEQTVHGDSGYLSAEQREDAVLRNKNGKKVQYKINRSPSQSKNNSARSKAQVKRRKREKSSVRAKVDHVFAVVKGRFRYRKTRYRSLQNQAARLNMMFALANLIPEAWCKILCKRVSTKSRMAL